MAWGKLDSTTLVADGDTISSTTMTSKKFNQILIHIITPSSGNTRAWSKFGNTSIDSGANYAQRYKDNGGTENTNTSLDLGTFAGNLGIDSDHFSVRYMINIATEEKLGINFSVFRNTAGAGTAPSRTESVGKWVNTSAQFNLHQASNDEAGNFGTNSNVTIMGTD